MSFSRIRGITRNNSIHITKITAGCVDEFDRDGLAIVGPVLAHQFLGFRKNLQVENETNYAQQQIPSEDPVHVSQIDGAGVNGYVSGPERGGDDDERQS